MSTQLVQLGVGPKDYTGKVKHLEIQMMQLGNNYGNQYYLPYSSGVLTAYARQFQEISDNCSFSPAIYARENPEVIADKIGKVDVLGVSVYVWNWWLSCAVSKIVKERHPDTIIIFGGPHVPDNDPDFFDKSPFIDVIAHGEGEVVFTELLKVFQRPDFQDEIQNVPSISFLDKSGQIVTTPNKVRMQDLSLPSPFLTGCFDDIMEENQDLEWNASWETNRGCPFKCTFCDWGSATASKVISFPWEKIVDEMKWFVSKKIKFVFGCDANFGIRPRDMDIVTLLAESKKTSGYPETFTVCYTKNSSKKVFDIVSVLHEANMDRGVSLSMQSLHEPTLKAIKRDNIKLETFEELQKWYNEAGISTYTELIMALPRETYDSFSDGIDMLFQKGQHGQIAVYNCAVMPNAELADPEYKRIYGIQTVDMPIFLAHSEPSSDDSIREREPIVISTSDMNTPMWKKTYQFSVVIQCFHSLGLLQSVAIFFHYYSDKSYKHFYESFIKFGSQYTLLRDEFDKLDQLLDGVLQGKGLEQYVDGFGKICWHPEESMFLRISMHDVHTCLKDFVSTYSDGMAINPKLIDDLLLFQRHSVAHWSDDEDVALDLEWNIPEYIESAKDRKITTLKNTKSSYLVSKNKFDDPYHFAKECIWYGRKGSRQLLKWRKV